MESPSFESIQEAKRVYETIRNAQKSAGGPPAHGKRRDDVSAGKEKLSSILGFPIA
jgi:hypothetical protein